MAGSSAPVAVTERAAECGISTSSIALSTGIAQPSNQAVVSAVLVNTCLARSKVDSSLACSAGVSGAPMLWRSAAAAPASRSERSASSSAAAVHAKHSSRRAIPRLCSSSWKIFRLSRYRECALGQFRCSLAKLPRSASVPAMPQRSPSSRKIARPCSYSVRAAAESP